MLGYSYPPLVPLLLDLSSDTDYLLVVRLASELLPEFGNFVVLMGISTMVTMSS